MFPKEILKFFDDPKSLVFHLISTPALLTYSRFQWGKSTNFLQHKTNEENTKIKIVEK
jgi:hypothetical protein